MPVLHLPPHPPALWPRFTSPLRSLALTARLGRVLGICFAICFVTGLLSHYQYQAWSWLPEPASPVWLYRVTQGLHVTTGVATIPLLLVKLWSVYPRLFTWPPVRTLIEVVERLSVFVLVSSALVELLTGFVNTLDWYPWPWSFVPVHRFLGYVLIGSLVLHIAVKLPDISRGLATPLAHDGTGSEDDTSSDDGTVSEDDTGSDRPGVLSRRGLLVATGSTMGLVIATSVGSTITPLQHIGLLNVRQSAGAPQGVPVNKTAAQARIAGHAQSATWRLQVMGPIGFTLGLEEVERLAQHAADLPIACVEGWSVGAHWRGLRLIDLVRRAGGNSDSQIRVVSLEQHGSYRTSIVDGPQVGQALLATHLNNERLDLDHGYPLRLIAPNRAGVHNTKWLSRIEVL
ncbi:molybdopterin-dependent oxidoreductase [uncultured Jatrophihabitans sp.]|uniref:molybdopterin-dependent oxidoreductase n=1 Tax=uncultured Jatrophihabitans sp. TaxID=1610747 RepID=UPI0035CBBF71